ncbi:MAG: hypothetical protein H6574_24275 [Lewinellaceae bacterium]|nr:hypothetical protein [Saprospiraceae bacterium]MCB9334177.1 hypothetical protein [Lewinellaceae bacterium]
MKQLSDYRFTVGILSVLAGILALACIWVGTLAVEFNFDAFSDPVLTLQYAHNHALAKWFNLLDLFGYYLLLLPLVFYFHQQYKYRSPWMPLITFSGAAYALVGALGAAILTALWPEQMKDYLTASPEEKQLISTIFSTTTLLVTKGMWNILEVLFAAVWWIGLGRLLWSERKTIGLITMAAGISTLLDALGNIFEILPLSELGMNIYLVLGIVWPVVIGISLMRKSGIDQSSDANRQVNAESKTKIFEPA